MITPVLYNLYISILETRKAGFSLYLYSHQRSATKHFSETLWQTICSIAAMCLMWALDHASGEGERVIAPEPW